MKLFEQMQQETVTQSYCIEHTTIRIADSHCCDLNAEDARQRIKRIKQIYLMSKQIRIPQTQTVSGGEEMAEKRRH
ncbi:hypothetical protein CLOSTMETH_01635 [[Clostridium] methylpentosum DSM 5476]|uniref:Uncharacterized protein n=1 Tax=[Clostridium] methylpentosum DSM 5476 TaxID=537013 RepID=C0ECR4_9FIRM|nr:hypothetical protein CLOSTMETH_01635 [[Clostridium] methylpentosum DSM 5476]MDY3989745.1 hypothetical protein [Massilioclostridium sp.]